MSFIATTTNEERKNLIFVTGNALSEFKTVAENIAHVLDRSVLVDEPDTTYQDYTSVKEFSARKSLYFAQALFCGSLPSRRNIVFCSPNLTLRTIFQFLVLFERIPKNVFVVVDDRYFFTALGKKRFDDLMMKLPEESRFYLNDFVRTSTPQSPDVITRLCKKIMHNARFATTAVLCTFNAVLARIPETFQDEFKKVLFGGEFGDIPFEKISQCLLPKFNDSEKEDREEMEIEEKKSKYKSEKKIPDYFKPETNEKTLSPIIEIEDDEEEPLIFPLTDFLNSEEEKIPPRQLK